MDITRTQYKLEEARFFLKCLEEHWRHVPQVDFYISACISSARSVTWVMKSEFGKKEGWENWYNNKKPDKEIRELLKGINSVRVNLTKTTPVKTKTTASITIEPEDVTPEVMHYLMPENNHLVRLDPVDKTNTMFYVRVNGKNITKAYLEKASHEIPAFEGHDAKNICSKYIKELDALVDECHSKFHR